MNVLAPDLDVLRRQLNAPVVAPQGVNVPAAQSTIANESIRPIDFKIFVNTSATGGLGPVFEIKASDPRSMTTAKVTYETQRRLIESFLANAYVCTTQLPGTSTFVFHKAVDLFSEHRDFAFLERLYALDAAQHVDEAIDAVYELCLPLLEEGSTDRLGQIMSLVDVNRLGVESALAFLAITLPAARAIKPRSDLLKRVRERITAHRSAVDADRLLAGLG